MTAKRTRVFCVDDHDAMLSCYRAALDSEPDMEFVGSSASTDGLLEAIEDAAPSVVVLDLLMHGCSVLESLAEIHARFPDVAVLVASALDDRRVVEEVHRRGASGFVVKGNLERLTQAIRSVSEGGTVSLGPLSRGSPRGQGPAELR